MYVIFWTVDSVGPRYFFDHLMSFFSIDHNSFHSNWIPNELNKQITQSIFSPSNPTSRKNRKERKNESGFRSESPDVVIFLFSLLSIFSILLFLFLLWCCSVDNRAASLLFCSFLFTFAPISTFILLFVFLELDEQQER